MTRTHILLDYRCIPNIANTEDYPWGEYKVGRGVEAKIPRLALSFIIDEREQISNSPYACLRHTSKFHHQASF